MHSPGANCENLDQRITEEIWAAAADGKVAWRRLSEDEARELNRLADHTRREQHTRHSLGDPGFENAAYPSSPSSTPRRRPATTMSTPYSRSVSR
ncbi:hypothetical protein [Nocardia fluminea]|uniref:hypothetical protein n=1 Tax=Nocardia fluminea TaxID=134984 RepID=UPI00364CAD37